jgi:pSer/pThr/pTyr-binding forkhead associated (FHA) protein
MSGGANVTGKSGGASQGALLHTGMMRLVPLNNGCLAPLEISGKKRELSIGRGKIENDYRLSGSQISRVHARVYMKDGDVYLRDAGSTNGTFVNSVRLGENEEIKLNRGDVVAFATEEFFVS